MSADTAKLELTPKLSEGVNDLSSNDESNVEDGSVCPICYGSGMEIVDGKGARKCSCRSMDREVNIYEKSRIPRRYSNCHFHNYKPQNENESQKRALKLAMKFNGEYPAVQSGLLISGPVGVGKTHLAVSILKGLTERGGFKCLFYEFGSLLKEIQSSYNPNTQTSELTLLAPVLTADVLVLDELGASKPTDWVKDTMAYIINTRYNENKLTIFTTNYLDVRIGSEETLTDRIGVRLRSRLFEMCRSIQIDGEDYRKKFQSSLPS